MEIKSGKLHLLMEKFNKQRLLELAGIDSTQIPAKDVSAPKITMEPDLLAKLLHWAKEQSVSDEKINNLITNMKLSVNSGRELSVADYDRIIQGFNAQDSAQKTPAPMAYGDYKSVNPTRAIPYTNFSSYVS